MKLPTENRVITVRGEQRGSRECYLSSIRKVEPRDVHAILIDVDMADVPSEAPPEREDVDMIDAPPEHEELSMIDEIDLHLTEHETRTTPVEELEIFPIDPATSRRRHGGHRPQGQLSPPKDRSSNCPASTEKKSLNPKRYEALKEEVQKLIKNVFIREAIYSKWVSNPILVKKHNGKWMVCIDFTNLNKVCPKNSFSHPRIDQLVDSTVEHELLSFMDAYSGYNQISMYLIDEENTSFTTNRGLYCYKMMPFGLKNTEATYQKLINKMFVDVISKKMEVYVDDMLVKSLKVDDHVKHLDDTFRTLRRYRMKLNPLKCAFGIASGKFMGYMVNQREIEANPEKINALLEMRSPQKPKEVQSLMGRVVLKVGKKLKWNEEYEEAFQGQERHLGQAPLLSKPKPGDIFQVYLVVSNEAISVVLTREEGTTQLPVYYTSKALLSPKTHYFDMEKLALALITASRKLKPYFQAHTIYLLTNFPLRQVLQKPDASRRLLKWAVELSEFDIVFEIRASSRNLFVDGSTGDTDSGVGVVLVSPEGHKLNSTVRFGFKATNNAAKYEALLVGLRLAREMQVRRLRINSNSQLVIPRLENTHADALSKLVSSKDSELLAIVLPINKDEAYKLRRRLAHFLFIDDVLYKRSFSSPLLRCVGGDEATYILRKIHEGVCGNHSGGLALAQKVLRQGKLDASKGAWVDELPQVLWAIRTTTKTLMGETPFLIAYGTEAMSPVEVGLASPCHLHFSEISNDELRRFNLDFIDERRDDSPLR
ncbi:uncharacterized protein LOC111402791 [Olea europaea var. sylvestris]|uniref:uncharacterized protein LOC111402791 n=1 Tax=Olea europaea var. sylvestris TaxID=158386 RepID=UPI000C1CF9C7|nr:uncharacterized protein LOC111402791 [Olea europaea var. sylvestris]